MKLFAKLAVFALLVKISKCIDGESPENEIKPAEVEQTLEEEINELLQAPND